MIHIAIFGASTNGERVYNTIEKFLPNIEVDFFLDNDLNKQNFKGLKVYRPKEIDLDSVVILIASMYYKEIKNQLIQLGLEENVHFYSAAGLYIANLDGEACEIKLKKLDEEKIKYRIITRNELAEKKKSDKLFILGSGTSINKLTYSQLKHIEQYDSWVLNFSNVHTLVPTFYSTEFCGENVDRFEMLLSNVKCRNKYPVSYIKDIYYYTKEHLPYIRKFFDEIPICKDIRLHITSKESMYSTLKLIQWLKLNEIFGENHYYLGGRTSVTTVLFHALALKYKEIILCGVDLKEDIYFFEESCENIFNIKLAKYPKRVINSKKLHETVRDEYFVPADKFILMINDIFFKEKNIKLTVTSKTSRLYPQLSIYDFGK